MKDFKGKFTDTNYLKNPQGTWHNAKNLLFTKKFNSPVNENGTSFIHLVRGIVCGVIDTNTEIVYLSKISTEETYNSIISIYSLDTGEVEEVLKGNFNFNRPIEGIYKYDYKGSLIVAWCDGVFDDSNPMRIAKVTNIDLPLLNGVLDDNDIKLIDLFPDINQGEVRAETSTGDVDGIYAYVTFKYGYEEEETVFKDLNTLCLLKTNNGDSSNFKSNGIKLNFRFLDYTTYQYIRIGLYIIGEEENKSYITDRIPIDNWELEYDITTLINLTSISNEELVVPKERFTKGETMTQFESSLLIGQVKKEEPFRFQKYVSRLRLDPDWTQGKPNKQHDKHLQYNEVYNFHIQFDLTNGETSDWFHIPNTPPAMSDTNLAWDMPSLAKHKLNHNGFSETQQLQNFIFDNTGSINSFGYWENKETYPNDDEYNGTIDYDGTPLGGFDLRGKQVRLHRVMEEDNSDMFKPTIQSQVIDGVILQGWSTVPVEVRNQIYRARIGFTKRNYGNSLVVANAIAIPSCDTRDLTLGAGQSEHNILSRTNTNAFNADIDPANLNTVRAFGIHNGVYYGFSFNRAILFASELELLKPKLNFNMVMVHDIKFENAPNFPTTPLSDEQLIINGTPRTIKDYNKFWWGYKDYAYKLSNNLEQGTRYLDGGLFVQFTGSNTYIGAIGGAGPGQGGGFLPHSVNVDAGEFSGIEKFMGLDFLSACPKANITLLNVQDNLYSLKDKEIVSSVETLYPGDGVRFALGDVARNVIKGQVTYRLDQNAQTYSTAPINLHTTGPLSSAILELKNNHPRGTIPFGDTDDLNLYNLGYAVNTSIAFASLNSLAGYQGFDFLKPFITIFPGRVIRSAIIPDEGYIINNYRIFFVNNYHEVKQGKGDIVALRSNDTYLFIQLRFALLLAEVKDVLRTKNVDAYLQSADIFDRSPKVLTLDPKGYIGSDHKFACKITKEGYIVIDHRQGNIIIAKPQINIISRKGIRNDLIEDLEFDASYIEIVNGIRKYKDNPFEYIGFSIGIDEVYNRLYVCKLYPPQQGEGIDRKEYYNELLAKVPPAHSVPILVEDDKGFTLSYSLDGDLWLCNHDFSTALFIGFKKELYALKNVPYASDSIDTGILHAMNRGLKGTYFGIKEESYIDLIFNANPDTSKDLYMINLITERFLNAGDNIEVSQKTISKIMVFNDTQCSGILVLDTNNKDVIRLIEGSYNVNNLRDILINPDLPILNDSGDLIESNLNYNKIWFDKSYFSGKFIVVRLIWNNDVQDDIYVNEVKVNSRISKR